MKRSRFRLRAPASLTPAKRLNFAHTTGAERRKDFVRAEVCAESKGHKATGL